MKWYKNEARYLVTFYIYCLLNFVNIDKNINYCYSNFSQKRPFILTKALTLTGETIEYS